MNLSSKIYKKRYNKSHWATDIKIKEKPKQNKTALIYYNIRVYIDMQLGSFIDYAKPSCISKSRLHRYATFFFQCKKQVAYLIVTDLNSAPLLKKK